MLMLNLTKKTKLKKGDDVLDIASNDGTLLKNYNRYNNRWGIDPIIHKFKKEYKTMDFSISEFFNSKSLIKKKYITDISSLFSKQKNI